MRPNFNWRNLTARPIAGGYLQDAIHRDVPIADRLSVDQSRRGKIEHQAGRTQPIARSPIRSRQGEKGMSLDTAGLGIESQPVFIASLDPNQAGQKRAASEIRRIAINGEFALSGSGLGVIVSQLKRKRIAAPKGDARSVPRAAAAVRRKEVGGLIARRMVKDETESRIAASQRIAGDRPVP